MRCAFDVLGRRIFCGLPHVASPPEDSFWKIEGNQLGFVLALLVGCIALARPAGAQDKRPGNMIYVRAGASITDYSGDADGAPGTDDATDAGDLLFDTRKFTDGDTLPYALSGELGYRVSSAFDIGLGYQFGEYAFIHGRPFTTREGSPGKGGDLGTVRHTVRVLGRYTFKANDWTVAPYLDGGINATFGGRTPGFGPSTGAGLDIRLDDHTSLFLETRVNVVINDDAVDGLETGTPVDALTKGPALGIRYNVRSTGTTPRLLALECPTDVRAVEPVSLTARTNAEDASRPVNIQWAFGDGRTASGRTVSHTFGRPGTYSVTAAARNDAGTARKSCSVTVDPVAQPALIASIDATPTPVQECDAVRFEANVEGDRPIEHEWQFDSGAFASGPSATQTYDDTGLHTARLVASNEHGTDRDAVTVRVERPQICTTVRNFSAVSFARNSSALTDEAKQKLQENAEVLLRCPNLQARIGGAAAPDEASPQALSEARAEAVATFYKSEGLSPESLQIVGAGAKADAAGKKGPAERFRQADTVPVQVEDKCSE